MTYTKKDFTTDFLSKYMRQMDYLNSSELISISGTYSMMSLYQSTLKSQYYNLYNKLNTTFSLNKENNYKTIFITLTASSKFHNVFAKIAKIDYKSACDYAKSVLIDNKLIFRDVFKRKNSSHTGPLFPRSSYNYVQSTEVHKSGMFHIHFAINIEESLVSSYLKVFSTFYNNKKDIYKLGRVDVRIENKKYLSSDIVYSRQVSSYVSSSLSSTNLKSGSFLYYKIIKDDKKGSISAYVAKYALKNVKRKMDLTSTSADIKIFKSDPLFTLDQAIFSYTNVRRYSFSRFLFPSFLTKFVNPENGNALYSDYSLKELTLLNNADSDLSVSRSYSFSKRFSKSDFIHLLYNKDLTTSFSYLSRNYDYFFKIFKEFNIDLSIVYSRMTAYFERLRFSFVNKLSSFTGYVDTIYNIPDLCLEDFFHDTFDFDNLVDCSANIVKICVSVRVQFTEYFVKPSSHVYIRRRF